MSAIDCASLEQHRDNAENDSSQAWATGPGREINMVRTGAMGGPRKAFPRWLRRRHAHQVEPFIGPLDWRATGHRPNGGKKNA